MEQRPEDLVGETVVVPVDLFLVRFTGFREYPVLWCHGSGGRSAADPQGPLRMGPDPADPYAVTISQHRAQRGDKAA